MKQCPKCRQVNEDKASVCYNCGHKFSKSPILKNLMKLLLAIIIVAATGAAGFGVWYFLQPKYEIYPEINKITMDGDGDSREIKIITDAPYSEWEAYSSYSWINIVKKENLIIIECDPNDWEELGERIGYVYVHCTSGRNQRSVEINVEQGEDTNTIRGEIKNVSAYYSNNSQDLTVKVKCSIHNLDEGTIKCILWFYHEDGSKLIDTNRKYYASDGHVCTHKNVWGDFTHDYTFELSIPISELHLTESEKIRIGVGLTEYESNRDGRRFVEDLNAKSFYVAL